MQGIQLKISKKMVDTNGQSFLIESMVLHGNVAAILQKGEVPEEPITKVDTLYLPMEIIDPETNEKITYFVHVDDRRLFNDLVLIGNEFFQRRMQQAHDMGWQEFILEEMPPRVEHARKEGWQDAEAEFLRMGWWKRLFYRPETSV